MSIRTYALISGAYWSFTITDGALRMLVLLYFRELGYGPLALASLFLVYEFFGVLTNLLGGWLGARRGLKTTLISGLALQIVVLLALSFVPESWPQVVAIMSVSGVQAFSGIAKDLTKMSSKTAVKFIAGDGRLFTLVAALTGSKNALKGLGYFVGAALLQWVGFREGLWILAALVAAALAVSLVGLGEFGQAKKKPAFKAVLEKSPAIQRLSLARFFLFGSRDIWFVVALPLFLESLSWSHAQIGTFLALWLIGYGIVQALAPRWLSSVKDSQLAASGFLPPMAATSILVATAVWVNRLDAVITLAGLAAFGVMFALTSAVHSYLILAYSETNDDAPMDVGYYYAANAAGRFVGTFLSGALYLIGGPEAAFIGTAAFLTAAFFTSAGLPPVQPADAEEFDALPAS